MVQVSVDEKAQLRALSRWGRLLVIPTVLFVGAILLVVVAITLYQRYQDQQTSIHATQFQSALLAANNDTIADLAIINEPPAANSAYGAALQLIAARVQYQHGNNEAAMAALDNVITHSDTQWYQHVARIQQMQLLLANNQPQAAIALANTTTDRGAYAFFYDWLLANAYQADNDAEQAAQYFASAKQHLNEQPMFIAQQLQRLLDYQQR